ADRGHQPAAGVRRSGPFRGADLPVRQRGPRRRRALAPATRRRGPPHLVLHLHRAHRRAGPVDPARRPRRARSHPPGRGRDNRPRSRRRHPPRDRPGPGRPLRLRPHRLPRPRRPRAHRRVRGHRPPGAVMTNIPPALEITSLRKRYGQKVAVDGLTLRVEQGEIFGILGPNGAGKTTTVECAEGLRQPDGGAIRVFGIDPYRDRARARQLVGAQLQESQLPDKITVAEAIGLYASFYPRPADTGALLARLGLTEKRDTSYRKLSGGQKQRLSIALALVGRPRLTACGSLCRASRSGPGGRA